jgi:hypothetical protein
MIARAEGAMEMDYDKKDLEQLGLALELELKLGPKTKPSAYQIAKRDYDLTGTRPQMIESINKFLKNGK